MRSNKGQLISQHIEKIDRSILEEYPEIIKEHIKGKHGVYVLYRNSRLYYVGLAANLNNRLNKHLKDSHAQTWDTFSAYLTIDHSHRHELETLILKIASPKGNKISGKFVNSENLKPLLKRAFIKGYKDKLNKFGLTKAKEAAVPKIIKGQVRKAALTPYVKNKFEIRLKYKGILHKATVRKDGTILSKGKVYNSPSMASRAIKQRATNGWKSWLYERAPGDWVVLDVLRKK